MNDARDTRPIELPPPLRDWTPWLAWFDSELAELLGDLVLRMAELVGPTYSTRRAGGEEPDGLGDIRARGSYERLIATEWALADEVPEEFLRRAASSEHLFLTPRLRTPVSERAIVAIFDTGPLQLGAPRLAHVAAWILLARRAAELGGRLRWGQMQAPGVLSEDAGESALKALLKARTYKPADPSAADAWLAHLNDAPERQRGQKPPAEVEVWWIGFGLPAPPREASAWNAIRVRPDMLGEHLELLLDRRSGSRRALLPMPPERVGALVVRGEFRTPVAQPTRLDSSYRIGLTHAPMVSFQSSHIGVRDVEGNAILVFAIPQVPQKGAITPRRHTWSTRRSAVATLLDGRQPGALCTSGELLHFWQLPGFTVRERPSPDVFDSTVAAARMLPMALLDEHFLRRLCVIDRTGRLVAWDSLKADAVRKAQSNPHTRPPEAPSPEAQVLATGAIGMAHFTANVAHVVIETPEGPCLLHVWPRSLGRHGRALLCPPIARADKAWFAYVTPRRQTPFLRGVALRHSTSPERWTVLPRQGAVNHATQPGPSPVEVLLGPGLKAMGLCVDAKGDLQFVVLGVDRKRLMLHGLDGRVSPLAQAQAPIEQCTVDPLRGYVVFITRERELVVMDPREGRTMLLVRSEAGEDA